MLSRVKFGAKIPEGTILLVAAIVMLILGAGVAVMVLAQTTYPSNVSPVATTLVSTVNSEQLNMERYTFPQGGPLTVTLDNVGSVAQNLQDADYYVNGVLGNASLSSCTSGSTANALAPAGSCIVTVSLPLTSLYPDAAYQFKVVLANNQVFLYSVFYGYSG
jgi:FlaG/FlaF family flagellin (archaellin)